MFRKLKDRINTIVRRWGFAPLFVACNVPAAPPNPPTDAGPTATTTTGATLPERCAAACAKFEADGCTQADKVCANNAFDDSGECVHLVTCEEACQDTPDFYLDQECELP
jgi:hypothetical protein